MVKPDVKQDYYADLELKPTADSVEIKKQFKRLGESSCGGSGTVPLTVNPTQLFHTIPTAIPVAKLNSTRSSRPSRQHMKFSQIHSSEPNMIKIVYGRALGYDPVYLLDRQQAPSSQQPTSHHLLPDSRQPPDRRIPTRLQIRNPFLPLPTHTPPMPGRQPRIGKRRSRRRKPRQMLFVLGTR